MPKLTQLKATLLLSLVILMLFSGCYSSYEIASQNYKYDNSISFTIDKVKEGYSISTGSGHYYPKRGNKFVFLFVTLKNSANESQKLDFGNFYLLEPKSHTKYKAELVMLESVVNLFGQVDSEIQKNDTKKRKLVFSFPDNEKAEMFSVNDVIYNIKYAGTVTENSKGYTSRDN